jgi:hypothetical protein
MHTVASAEQQIVAEWRAWAQQHGSRTSTDMLQFFGWLQQHKSYMLSFRSSGDKWQRVHGWLERDEATQSMLRPPKT